MKKKKFLIVLSFLGLFLISFFVFNLNSAQAGSDPRCGNDAQLNCIKAGSSCYCSGEIVVKPTPK